MNVERTRPEAEANVSPELSAAALATPPAEDGVERPENGGGGRVPMLASEDAEVDIDALVRLRAFHMGVGDQGELKGDFTPALLWPYRDARKVRTDFPLLLFPPDEARVKIWAPLGEALTEAVDSFASDDGARILRDNLVRLERIVREQLEGEAPVGARDLLLRAGASLKAELKLGADNDAELSKDLDAMQTALPDGRLLGFSENADLYLMQHAVFCQLVARRAEFSRQVGRLVGKLRDLLEIDKQKGAEARSAASLKQDSGGGTDSFVNFDTLSRVMGDHRGTVALDPARRERIERVLQVLESQGTADRPLMMVVHDVPVPSEFSTGETEDVCERAMQLFDAQATVFSEVFRAMRIARLEVEGRYDPARHDAWLQTFDWQALSVDELLCLPVVVAVTTDDKLAQNGIVSLSRLLVSGRPIQVLARVRPASNPGMQPGQDPLTGYRLELAYLGVSHREAFVHQCCSARPTMLEGGFGAALSVTRASLHVLTSGIVAGNAALERLGPWMYAGAALEGRAHPFFRYEPDEGQGFARRLEFSANPEPGQDWPVYPLVFMSASGEQQTLSVPFTFADFALLEPEFARHFCVVDNACAASGDLVTVDKYLELEGDECARCIPFVWAVDAQAQVRRLVISRELALATRDRLSFWHTLQELAGVRSEHIDHAVELAKIEAAAEAAKEREALVAAHAEELERAIAETASEAMERLAAVLTNFDPASLNLGTPAAPAAASAAPAAAPADAPAEAAPEAPAAEAAPAEEEDDFGYDEPMIDSALCTSCNDCINLNQLLFVYDGNKQAKIGDVSKGTFAQLVEAAEKCPARCIHPGKPQNPDEANLEELIKRAAPFN